MTRRGLSMIKKGFYVYSVFSKPEFVGGTIEELKKNVVISEGLFLASSDITHEVFEMLDEEIEWIKNYYQVDSIDLSNEEIVEDLNNFFYPYHIFVNPTLEDFQMFNRSVGLNEETYLEDFMKVVV